MGLEKCTRKVPASTGFLTVLLLLFGAFMPNNQAIGQCKLNCSDHVYLSLDENCEYEVLPADVAKNYQECTDTRVELYDKYNNAFTTATKDHRGQTLVYKMFADNNTCWGYVTFEDKMAPAIMCMDTLVDCWTAETFLNPTIADNCYYDARMEEINRKWVDFNCENPDTVGYIQRSVVTIDLWGNTNRCEDQRLYIKRESLDSVVCDTAKVIECCSTKIVDGKPVYILWDPKYVYEDEYGYSHPIPKPGGLTEPPYIDGIKKHWLTPDSNNKGKCNIVTTYKDHIIPTCGSSYKIRREWKLFDWCTAQETLCVQWIKIVDEEAPVLKQQNASYPEKTICFDGSDYEWNPQCESGRAVNLTPESGARTFYVQSHDCKAHVTLKRPEIEKECSFLFAKGDPDKLEEAHKLIHVSYLIRYVDYWSEGHDVKVLTGDIPYGQDVNLYLPAGWFRVIYFVKDDCWNETYACEDILVHDNIPPTPVCDEITQVTLDPEYCWTRMYAEDLDDGSNDNCSHKLHFAVASQDTIEYYRQKWADELKDCHGEYEYNHHYDLFQDLITDWINCYVFNDYIDVTECGEEQLVLRVYEADGLPLYDPHIFKGSKHQWFCYNLYDDYACWFGWNYDKFAGYERPMPELCDYELEGKEGFYYLHYKKIEYYDWNCYGPCLLTDGEFAESIRGPIKDVHGPQPNPMCCTYMEVGHKDHQDWLDLVEEYPELYRLHCKRYEFKHLYNDCWITVLKDDKTPPVCVAPEDAVWYCDGVPYHGYISPNGGVTKVAFWGAQFAHDICEDSDTWAADCFWDEGDPGIWDAPNDWCVKPGWNNDHGYYMGPSSDNYSYDDPCNEDLLAWYPNSNKWKPIYCRFWLMLDVFDDPSYGKPDAYTYFGTPTISDNCWYPEVDSITEGTLDECGVGYLTRTWTVTDKCGNTSSCYQTITVKPRSDFEVKFPADYAVECDDLESLDPDKTNPEAYPQVTDDDCELIGITYNDQVLDISEDGCFKILRTWKIIDWCVYSPDIHDEYRYADVIVDDRCVAHEEERPCVYRQLKDDGDGYMTYLQVIRVIDDVEPEVICSPDSIFCIYDENCDDLLVEYDLGMATDNCTEDLDYRYAINPNGDSDEADWIFGHGYTLQNTLPVGEHKVILYARDNCGNEGYCELTITVKDCKPPTPYCYNGIATVVMPSTGEVTVWARDLDAGSFDNCTEMENLRFTFSSTHPDEDDTYSDEDKSSSMVFDCDQLGQVTVNIYVWDESDNVDFCETYLLIQPGSDACPGASLASISGEIATDMVEAVEFAKVELGSNSGSGSEFETGVDGHYRFGNLQANNDYKIAPERNDAHDNGVSTLDLVLIQKHILGLEVLPSPYRVIAADVNNSGGITALDLVELRRLILGVFDEFPNNSSWNFVPKDYEFADEANPWDYPKFVDVPSLGQENIVADFIGIKTGDVNASVMAHSLFGAEIRTGGSKLVLQTLDQQVVAGTEVTVTMKASNFENINGYQFTLSTPGLTLTDITAAGIELSNDNFASHKDAITTSWHSAQPMTVDGDLFTLSFMANESGLLSDLLKVKSTITNAEAYVNQEVLGVNLEFVNDDNQVVTGDYRLMQNSPNPFDEETLIGFVLPQAGPANIQIMDVSGKLIKEINGDFNQGFNQVKISEKDLSSGGVLYYQLRSGEFTATKKMILIK